METPIFGEIIEGKDYINREGVYGILLNNKNQIGIISTPRGRFLPGGGIEEGENHIKCIQREFAEEAGLGIEVKEYMGSSILYGLAPRYKDYFKMTGYFYRVILNGITVKRTEDDHELIWVGLDEAERTLKLEHQVWAVKELNASDNIC
jgi:8-oxo-dGTP diphosphatase